MFELLTDEEILSAWNRSGTTNLYTYQEKGRPITREQRYKDLISVIMWLSSNGYHYACDEFKDYLSSQGLM